MGTAAAARAFWAALQRRSRKPMRASGSPVLRMVASHASSYVLMALAAAMLVCAVAGLTVTVREDRHLSAERHAAVQRAVDEVQATSGGFKNLGDGQIEAIARRIGLPDLRLDAADGGASEREVQSVQDAQGRIIGWFSWTPDRALIRDLIWLWGLTGGLGALLGICALLAAGMIQRLARSLSMSTRTIRKLTREDTLTGLPNHRVMLERLNDALARRRAGIVVLALIDLDGFREVNDTQGRAGGDALFKAIAERLHAALPPDAVFGRFEDDEFAVIVGNADARTAMALTESLRTALSRPIFLEQDWQISAGIGIVQAPADGKTSEELGRRAGLALRAAKRKGRGTVQHFEPYIEMEDSEERFIRRELQSALASRSLDVHYQPVVAAAGGGVIGVEALLRWTHPTRGPIAPSVFIPLAERSGLMSELGAFVLRRALTDAVRWPALSMAVNLSPVQIRDPNIVDMVASVMRDAEIAPSRVVLEVTEGVLIEDPQDALLRLEALRALGVRIALDDFGTGYSSLSYLQRFPFSQIKIDRAFVVSLGATGNAGAIIQSIVTLGHALGMKVLAEGVETDEQRVLLRLAGCDEMQGYLFAKPQPAAAIDKIMARAAADRRIPKQAVAAAR